MRRTHGFVTRPYEELVSSRHGLPVPKMFQRFFPRVLNCGKSIEVLTMLQKQGRFPSSRFMHYTEVTEIHAEFVKNLKAHLGPGLATNSIFFCFLFVKTH